MRWADVEREVPDLARAVRERFAVRKHATMATLRRDGSPRISGTEVELGEDVTLGSMAGARKAADLLRDGRVAIHSPTVDPESPESWTGEAKVAGVARHTRTGDDGAVFFAVDVREVVLTRLGTPPDHLVVESWHEGRGYTRVERR